LNAEVVDIREPTEAAIADVRAGFAERRHQVTLETAGAAPLVLADRGRLEQVFVNLLSNSAKYTNDGGNIQVSIGVEEQYVVVSVRDDGMGILPEVLPHVFELYVQSPRALPHSRRGLGVGLALVKMLVTLHGGNVEASSDGPGRGASFTVRLPRATVR